MAVVVSGGGAAAVQGGRRVTVDRVDPVDGPDSGRTSGRTGVVPVSDDAAAAADAAARVGRTLDGADAGAAVIAGAVPAGALQKQDSGQNLSHNWCRLGKPFQF